MTDDMGDPEVYRYVSGDVVHHCQGGRDGPLAISSKDDAWQEAWIAVKEPLHLREWR